MKTCPPLSLSDAFWGSEGSAGSSEGKWEATCPGCEDGLRGPPRDSSYYRAAVLNRVYRCRGIKKALWGLRKRRRAWHILYSGNWISAPHLYAIPWTFSLAVTTSLLWHERFDFPGSKPEPKARGPSDFNTAQTGYTFSVFHSFILPKYSKCWPRSESWGVGHLCFPCRYRLAASQLARINSYPSSLQPGLGT